MSSAPIQETLPLEQFKVSDSGSYDEVAEHFARFTDVVTKPLVTTMLRLGGVKPSDNVLDIGTGSGIVPLTAVHQIPGISFTGLDLSDGLLAVARRKTIQACRESSIRFIKSDAEQIPLRDQSVDAVLSMFALLHFPHPGQALREMYRVLKPGGRMVIGIGAPPPFSSLRGWTHRLGRIGDLIDLKMRRLLLAPAHLNALVDEYLPAAKTAEETELAHDRQARAPQAEALFRELPLTNMRTHWEGHHLSLHNAQEFWDLQSTFSSIARKRIQTADESQVRQLRAAFDRDCQGVLNQGGRLEYHYAAFYLCGERPAN